MSKIKDALIEIQRKYIEFLGNNIDSHIGFLTAHNIKPCTDEEYKTGVEFRNRIENIEIQIKQHKSEY